MLRQGTVAAADSAGSPPGRRQVVVDVSDLLGLAGLGAGTAKLMLVLDGASRIRPDEIVSAVRAFDAAAGRH